MDSLTHLWAIAHQAIDVFLHLDVHLNAVIGQYGLWTYLILVLIIFAETGLVVTPILPGDSLLFAVGTFAASGSLDLLLSLTLLCSAAIVGDAVNYAIGRRIGPRAWRSRWLKPQYLTRTQEFYERYGGKTILLARFVPIVRTFAPFLAGIGQMPYWRFAAYNVAGGIVWILGCVMAGYFFGNIPVVKRNFTLVLLALVLVSILPAVVGYLRSRTQPAKA